MDVYVVGSPVRSANGLYRLLEGQFRVLVKVMIEWSFHCSAEDIDNPVVICMHGRYVPKSFSTQPFR